MTTAVLRVKKQLRIAAACVDGGPEYPRLHKNSQGNVPIDHSHIDRARRTVHTLRGACRCSNIQTVNALAVNHRGSETLISTAFDAGLGQCLIGQCVHCPVAHCMKGALQKKFGPPSTTPINLLLCRKPQVRVMLGKSSACRWVAVSGRCAALRRLGFDAVLDTNLQPT